MQPPTPCPGLLFEDQFGPTCWCRESEYSQHGDDVIPGPAGVAGRVSLWAALLVPTAGGCAGRTGALTRRSHSAASMGIASGARSFRPRQRWPLLFAIDASTYLGVLEDVCASLWADAGADPITPAPASTWSLTRTRSIRDRTRWPSAIAPSPAGRRARSTSTRARALVIRVCRRRRCRRRCRLRASVSGSLRELHNRGRVKVGGSHVQRSLRRSQASTVEGSSTFTGSERGAGKSSAVSDAGSMLLAARSTRLSSSLARCRNSRTPTEVMCDVSHGER